MFPFFLAEQLSLQYQTLSSQSSFRSDLIQSHVSSITWYTPPLPPHQQDTVFKMSHSLADNFAAVSNVKIFRNPYFLKKGTLRANIHSGKMIRFDIKA